MMGGKVVLVPFPFDDLMATRVRPAVCLTDPVGLHRHVIMAFITSRSTENGSDNGFRAGRLCHDWVTSEIHAPAAPPDDGHDCTYQAGIGRIVAPNAGLCGGQVAETV